MDKAALARIPYGLYLLSTKTDETKGGCIVDVCAQINFDPPLIVTSVMNGNNTNTLLQESGKFTISILDDTCPLTLIRSFGFRSSRDVDKFSDYDYPLDERGIPYLNTHSCATLICDVILSKDHGTHTQYVGKVIDSWLINDNFPMMYKDYEKMAYGR